MSEIISILAREILDSRGNPTVEVDVELAGSFFGRAAVPSGASTGSHEAIEVRDGGDRFLGKGVTKAVDNINNQIHSALLGLDAFDQHAIDQAMIELDGTDNKGNLGANATLGVSMAVARAAADACGMPLWRYLGGVQASLLPTPLMNIINGGEHADNGLEIQEFMIVPFGFDSYSEGLRAGVETFHHLKRLLKADNLATGVGDEGGFAPHLDTNEKALQYILRAIESAGYKPGDEIGIALDCAANEFYNAEKNEYTLDGKAIDAGGLVQVYNTYCEKFPIVSIEDGCAEDDWDAWRTLSEQLGDQIQLVGDDLFVTNPTRLQRGIDEGIANSILIKVNQIGTVSETLETIQLAHNAGYTAVASHRSGETADTFISDLAVATSVGQIKTGSASRGERTAKYNQLLRIEEALGDGARYAGKSSIA